MVEWWKMVDQGKDQKKRSPKILRKGGFRKRKKKKKKKKNPKTTPVSNRDNVTM